VRISLRSLVLLVTGFLGFFAFPSVSFAQAQPAAPAKKPPMGPPSPQSTHYPILILAFGKDPNWSVRIGLKGPERLDRPGYPPIPLEPSEVTHDAGADSWTYHAKDSATGAVVTVHLSREACTDASTDTLTATPLPSGKYTFRVSVDHAQIGSLKGCARVATELFPKINNQPDQEEDDAKKKPPVPVSTVTNFKPPVAVAYLNSAGSVVFKRGQVARVVPAKHATSLSISPDGKKLVFQNVESVGNGQGVQSTVNEYEFDTNTSKELLRGEVQFPYWSPDGTRIAYVKTPHTSSGWEIWVFPDGSPGSASLTYSGLLSFFLHGWADSHTFLVTDQNNLYWIGDDGIIKQTIPIKDLCGNAPFSVFPPQRFTPNPINPDLLLVEARLESAPPGSPVDLPEGTMGGFFLYEIRSKRRVLLSPTSLNASGPEWSRDGFQIFFTGRDSSRHLATYRIFWDGVGLQKYLSGTGLVIGQ
jgi:uncharacterized membrane protein